MLTFTDRQPASGKENRYKLTKSDGSFEYVKLERADDANPIGTPLNKQTFENMQTATVNDVLVTGHYTGDGQDTRLINIGFKPRIIFILKSDAGNYNPIVAFATSNYMVESEYVTIENNGFSFLKKNGLNTSNTVYNYIAFR